MLSGVFPQPVTGSMRWVLDWLVTAGGSGGGRRFVVVEGGGREMREENEDSAMREWRLGSL